jgi:SAM-dependent methyltransferase
MTAATDNVTADQVERIVRSMGAAVHVPDLQRVQTRFRLRLPGASVLELGCGQGDMTAVLADLVSAEGRVVAMDPASPEYGAPVTLGQSAASMRAAGLGSRVDIRFEFDALDERNSFSDDSFDYVVLARCSWYFASADQLRDTPSRVRPWARRLRFSEWDLRPRELSQLPHLLAVLGQGTVEAGGSRGEGNVRTPLSREALLCLLPEAGWRVTQEHTVDDPAPQDADWEIQASLGLLADARLKQLPDALRDLVVSQADVLRSIAAERGNRPLCSYSILADRT